MLGLPAGVTVCLFDLDGVLTQTAKVHAAAWKQMFDAFLRARAERARRGLRPVRRGRATTTSTSTASRAPTACGRSLLRAGSICPRAAPTTPRTRRRSAGWASRKNEIVLQADPRGRRRALRRLGRLREGRSRRAVCAAASSRRAPTAATFSRRPGSRSCSRRVIDGQSPRPSTCRASRHRTPTSPARARSETQPAARGGLRGRAGRRRSRARRELRLVVGVDRVGQADALKAHGADVVVERSRRTARTRRDPPSGVPGRSVGVRETELQLDMLAQTESVFALSNGHIGLRGQPRRGRAVRPAGHLSRRLLRAAPAARTRRPAYG